MNRIKKIAARSLNYVEDHKVGIAVTATSAFWLWVMARSAKIHNEFLDQHGLLNEFYQTED